MDKIGILFHPHKASAEELGNEVEAWLADRGLDTWQAPGHDGRLPEVGTIRAEIVDTDLLVILGGDGSTLRAARAAAPYRVPIFGINMGRVGFLSEASPDNWRRRLGQVLAGEGWLEERLMLTACLQRGNQQVVDFVALNDVVVGRGAKARVLRLHLAVDQDSVTTYTADGLIVATPTGSTAYAMAAGGPLLPPQLSNFLIVPVAPHLSLDRAVILHEDAVVSIEVEMEHEATVAADGQQTTALQSGDQVLVTKHEDRTLFVRVGRPNYFYHRLMERLGFWHPKGLN
jgi:NAD+ kinase